jgi:hypothetical protein
MEKNKKDIDDVEVEETPVDPKPEKKEKTKSEMTEEIVFYSPDGNVIHPSEITHFTVNDKGDITIVSNQGIFTKKI